MIRTVLFDLGNVIVPLDFDRAYNKAALLSGLNKREVAKLMAESGLAVPYECGWITSKEFHRRTEQLLGLGLSFEDFGVLWGDMFGDEPLLGEHFLDELAPGVGFAMLSNTNELHFDWIRNKYPVARRFETTILSYEVGSMKPDARIYQAALEATGSRPEECFFTDDRAENIEGARALGIHAEVFEGAGKLREQLAALGAMSPTELRA
jgi:putative hydrolase of the HAD superfamily